jgi:hypothetical protein
MKKAAVAWLAFAASAFAADTIPVPTFSSDVAPILYKNCATCHRPGEIAPMSLLTYEQTRPWAKSIKEKVALGQMPPWHATQASGIFSNDRRLTDAEKNTLVRWASNGAPQGNPKDLPPVPQFTDGWEIGQPDQIFTMEKAYEVPASGTIDYQYVNIATNLPEDKWIQAIEVRPGVRRAVHHVLVFAKEAGAAPRPAAFAVLIPKPLVHPPGGPAGEPSGNDPDHLKPAPNVSPGILIATTAPGTNAMTFAPGRAIRIRAGTTLVLQIHYTAYGTAASDMTRVGVIYAKEPPRQEIRTSAFMNGTLKLPAGSPDTEVDSAIQFLEDSHITAIFPHTHLRGKSWEYHMVYPDGRSEVVLTVPKYDFNWQTYYVFTEPLAAPKGSRLEAFAHYDNSTENKWNPDPTVEVHWGEQTWQEMQYSGLTYFVDEPHQPASVAALQ